MKSNSIDAQDTMIGWMRDTNRRMYRLERKGRLDLLNEPEAVGDALSAVLNIGEIPEDIPLGQRVLLEDTGEIVVQDPVTREWAPVP